MTNQSKESRCSILYIPHGGGPLPLLGDPGHWAMVDFLQTITSSLCQPVAILLISAHWEEKMVTVTSGSAPPIIYDYYGFSDEAYTIQYLAPGCPDLADKIFHLLSRHNIAVRLDRERGFDHGLYIPLTIMYPAAAIPCVQMSLVNTLNPEAHICIGHALSDLRKDNVLIIGSGFSFHNMQAFFTGQRTETDTQNETFQQWLIETCTSPFAKTEREKRLIDWEIAPNARYCHPREDHLLPLHVCAGLANTSANLVFDGEVMGKKACAFLWQD